MQIFFSVFWWIYFFIFFSGYPLLYCLLYLIGKSKVKHQTISKKIIRLLPLTYAFVSTMFWILIVWTGRMNFVINRIAAAAWSFFIIAYSISALIFWLPYFRRRTYVSLLHSLVLFLLPFFNMLFKKLRHKVVPHDYLLNLFRIYIAGLIIYIIAIIVLSVARWLLSKIAIAKRVKHYIS